MNTEPTTSRSSTGATGTPAFARRVEKCARQRGIVLVLVLWVGALLGVIAASFAFAVRTDNTSIINAGARLQAEALAESAINRALLGLLGADRTGPWEGRGRVYETAFEGGTLRASVHAETGKIDLNAAPKELLEGLVKAAQDRLDGPPGDPTALTAAILDWRDADTRARPFGAEDPEYREAGLDHGAGDRAFLSVDELGRVIGMPRGLLDRLRPALTVYTRSPRIDPTTAPRLAMLAVPGLDRARVDAFLSERDRLAGQDSGGDSETAQVPLHLLAGAERHLASNHNRIYTVMAEGRTSDGVPAFRQAVVQINPGSDRPYVLLAWGTEPIAMASRQGEPVTQD